MSLTPKQPVLLNGWESWNTRKREWSKERLINVYGQDEWVPLLSVVCSECGVQHTTGIGGAAADNETELRVAAHALGWSLGGRICVCPRCVIDMKSGKYVTKAWMVDKQAPAVRVNEDE